MASGVKNFFHDVRHPHEKGSGRGLQRRNTNQEDESTPEFKSKKEEDKHLVASWESGSQKTPLPPDQVAKDPQQKTVGKSSKHLRCNDFKLITTLGTGTIELYQSMCIL